MCVQQHGLRYIYITKTNITQNKNKSLIIEPTTDFTMHKLQSRSGAPSKTNHSLIHCGKYNTFFAITIQMYVHAEKAFYNKGDLCSVLQLRLPFTALRVGKITPFGHIRNQGWKPVSKLIKLFHSYIQKYRGLPQGLAETMDFDLTTTRENYLAFSRFIGILM